jgi:hypothetical protein
LGRTLIEYYRKVIHFNLDRREKLKNKITAEHLELLGGDYPGIQMNGLPKGFRSESISGCYHRQKAIAADNRTPFCIAQKGVTKKSRREQLSVSLLARTTGNCSTGGVGLAFESVSASAQRQLARTAAAPF